MKIMTEKIEEFAKKLEKKGFSKKEALKEAIKVSNSKIAWVLK